jgi:hypothetical protein
MIIAGLMCLPLERFSSAWTDLQITRLILLRFEVLSVTELVHGEVTMSSNGPWNWCPQSILDFGKILYSSTEEKCYIQKSGSLWSHFMAYETLQDDIVVSCGIHPAQIARVSAALISRKNCLLLTTLAIQQQRVYILF